VGANHLLRQHHLNAISRLNAFQKVECLNQPGITTPLIEVFRQPQQPGDLIDLRALNRDPIRLCELL